MAGLLALSRTIDRANEFIGKWVSWLILLALQGISEIIKKIAIMRGDMDDPNPFISAHEQAELEAKALAEEAKALAQEARP